MLYSSQNIIEKNFEAFWARNLQAGLILIYCLSHAKHFLEKYEFHFLNRENTYYV